jgi:CheY-like chemotaxis protein
MNLVINARDAMPGGGDLTISTGTTHRLEEQAARPVGARPVESVVLTVADTGLGMDEETKRHIFEPFFTTKPRGFGTGLGLSIVYGIVQQSNGWVEVQSAPGAGTEFRIMLPVVVGAATSEVELSPKATPGHETILLVEDRDDVRLLTMAILEGLGYSVLVADSGAKALEISQRSQCEIDLLLTDVVMPGMTGAELAARLSELRPPIRVLFISGYSEAEGFEVGAVENGFHLLSKPFTPSALAAKVRNVLNR